MVDLGTELVAGCDIAGVMLVPPSGTTTPVATAPLAVALDDAQVEFGEGPGLYAALEDDPVVRVADLGSDGRWPAFGPRAVALGVNSALSFGLSLGEGRPRRIGALSLYSHTTAAFDGRALALGEVLAAQCVAALGAAIEIELGGAPSALTPQGAANRAQDTLVERFHRDVAATLDLSG